MTLLFKQHIWKERTRSSAPKITCSSVLGQIRLILHVRGWRACQGLSYGCQETSSLCLIAWRSVKTIQIARPSPTHHFVTRIPRCVLQTERAQWKNHALVPKSAMNMACANARRAPMTTFALVLLYAIRPPACANTCRAPMTTVALVLLSAMRPPSVPTERAQQKKHALLPKRAVKMACASSFHVHWLPLLPIAVSSRCAPMEIANPNRLTTSSSSLSHPGCGVAFSNAFAHVFA